MVRLKKRLDWKGVKNSVSVQRKALKDPQKTWRMTAQDHFKHKLQNKNKLWGGSGLLYSTVDIRYKNLETRVAKVYTLREQKIK